MLVASEQLQPRAAVSRRLGSAISQWGLPLAAVAALVGWLEWTRVRLTTPSLIDDWFGITYSSRALSALLHGDYSSIPVDLEGRYRPAYTAVWDYAQWHLLGGPSVATAAAWGALRAVLFVTAVWLLAAWLIRPKGSATSAVVWLAPLAVALTPNIAVDLTRHGPADPIMIAGLIIGLALVGNGVRALLFEPGAARVGSFAAIALGYLVYLLGVYSKEASISVIAFAPFFIIWLGPDSRARLLQTRYRRYLIAVVGVLLIAPIIHVAAHLAAALSAGQSPSPNDYGIGRRVVTAGLTPLVGAPGQLGTYLWLAVVPIALAVAILTLRRRRREGVLLAGVLTTGFLMSSFALALGDAPSRYYIPWLVAVAAVTTRGLAGANLGFRIAAVILILGIALSSTRSAVSDWERSERSGSTAVEMTKSAVASGCATYLASFDVERRVAIPLLFRSADVEPMGMCSQRSETAYAVSWKDAPLPPQLAVRCQSQWQKLAARDSVGLYRCGSLRPGRIRGQDDAFGRADVAVVRVRPRPQAPNPARLFPGSSAGAG